MTSELSILGLYGLLVLILVAVSVMLAVPQLGMGYLLGPRDEERKPHGLAGRMSRATGNSVIAMALFAPAVIAVQVAGVSTSTTLLAAQIFLISRLVYAPLYWVGVPLLRTAIWMVGFLATVYLYLMLL